MWWIGIHLGFTGTWLGTTLVLLILTIMETSSMDVDVRLSIPAIVYSLDGNAIRIAGFGAILTGGVLSGMYWGFTRFYWVIVKELASLLLFIFGLTWLEPLEHKAQSYASSQGAGAFHNAQFVLIHQEIIWTLIGWPLIMVALNFISKIKPWGKTKRS
jgi:hypothetical protein